MELNAVKTPYIFDIKRYSINDGPGIRVTLFFKGCPLSCVWCHNPEGVGSGQERMYTQNRCIACNTCIEHCPNQVLSFSREAGIVSETTRCTLCGDCASVCPAQAIEMVGKRYTVNELMREIQKERIFFDSSDGGGVTACGGEPLLFSDFLIALFKECQKEDIDRVLDTTLFCSPSVLEAVAEVTNLFLVDLKQMDSAEHERFTGVGNEVILRNIELVSRKNIPFWIRIPLIEGVNSGTENLEASAAFLARLPHPPQRVEILPYHDIAISKHTRLGTSYKGETFPMSTPSPETVEAALRIFRSKGLFALSR